MPAAGPGGAARRPRRTLSGAEASGAGACAQARAATAAANAAFSRVLAWRTESGTHSVSHAACAVACSAVVGGDANSLRCDCQDDDRVIDVTSCGLSVRPSSQFKTPKQPGEPGELCTRWTCASLCVTPCCPSPMSMLENASSLVTRLVFGCSLDLNLRFDTNFTAGRQSLSE